MGFTYHAFTRPHALAPRGLVVVVMAALLLSPAIVGSTAAAKKKEAATPQETLLDLTRWPTRNFLPPIATINPKRETTELKADGELEVVSLAAVTTPVLTAKPAVERLDSRLDVMTDAEKARREQQSKLEEADLNVLWEATVERNPVIRFSLEKLATPEDLAPEQSSIFMRKTLGVLISGATLASTMLPGAGGFGGYRNMGVMAGGDAIRNLTNGNKQPEAQRLSATEKIQLAGMIDDLQREVIQAYHDYRRTLHSLALAHQQTAAANNTYSQQLAATRQSKLPTGEAGEALAALQSTLLMSNGATYHQARLHELRLKQDAKQYRLQLERLAGPDAVATLKLATDTDSVAAKPSPTTANQVAAQ